MNIKLRLIPCVFSFRHTIIVLVFCLLTFQSTSRSDVGSELEGQNVGNVPQENLPALPEDYILLFKDGRCTPPPFVSFGKRQVNINKQGDVDIDLTRPEDIRIEILHKRKVIRFTEDENLIKMPKNIIDIENNKPVSVTFSSKIAFDGVALYVKEGTELTADHYKPKKVDRNSTDTISLERKKTLYLLEFIMPNEMKDLKLFDSIEGIITVSDNNYRINVEWNDKWNKYAFPFREGEEFELRPIIDDKRIRVQPLPYKIWTRNEKGDMEGKCPIELNPFNLIVTLTGEDSKKISSVKLISSKQQGTSEDGQFMGDQERKVRFVGLEWGKAPYEIRTLGTNCYSAPIGVDFDKDFEKLSKDTPTPVLTLEQPVWSYIEKFGIQLVSAKVRHIRNIRICLTESGKIPAAIRKNRDAAITDENGFVLFNDVYDWRNITLSIGEDKDKREIGLNSRAVKMTSGDKRIDLQINLDESNK